MDVNKLYTKAEEAIKRKNFDLAVEMLKNQILKYNPNDVKARKLLRSTIIVKHKTSPPSQSDVFSKGLMPRIKMAIGKMMKKWDMVIEEAENFLLIDPKNISVLFSLGEAASEAKYIDTAIFALENILSIDSSHINTYKKLGQIYDVHKSDLDKAQHFYQKAQKLDPYDGDVARMVKGLAAKQTSETYAAAGSSQDLIKDKDRAKELEEDQQMLRTDDDIKRAIDRSKKKLSESPDNKKELRRLGDLQVKLRRFDDAIPVFEKVLKLDPTSTDVKRKISACKISKHDTRLAELTKKLKQNPQDPALKQALKKAKKEKNIVEIQEYKIQVKDQPTNYELRYKLGKVLYQAGQYDEAIASFQYAIKDPRNKINAYNFMGQAFFKKKEYDLAEEQLKTALSSITTKDKTYQEVMYSLGLIYEASGKKDEAITTFTDIVKINIGYRDVSDRLKALKS